MKCYVVFKGFNPGVYTNWDDAREQVEGFPGAVYKSYNSSEAAAAAWRRGTLAEETEELKNILYHASERGRIAEESASGNKGTEAPSLPPEVDKEAWAVDASCLGNPGRMEYRGVEVATGKEIFRVGPFEKATNNIGEFLAIVHAMALMTREGKFHNIYSDSRTGMAWVRNRQIKTQLTPTPANTKVFELMARALTWLRTHSFPARVLKWETEEWGEIPADFGRK